MNVCMFTHGFIQATIISTTYYVGRDPYVFIGLKISNALEH